MTTEQRVILAIYACTIAALGLALVKLIARAWGESG